MNTAIETVVKLFIATDQQNWNEVLSVFSENVFLDYSSMTGEKGVEVSSKQIVDAWSSFLPGFENTHHQVGNFVVKENKGIVEVFCYGTATHFLTNENGNVWTVVGSYNFKVEQKEDQFMISSMVFNFKYQDGNLELPKLAQTRMA